MLLRLMTRLRRKPEQLTDTALPATHSMTCPMKHACAVTYKRSSALIDRSPTAAV
jgi:hypothetical protein